MTKINGSKSHLKLVGLAIFLAGFSFVFLSVSHSNVKADSESNRQHSLRAIIRHDHKAVCSRPRPGHASCTDVISTKSNGNPLISSPSTSGAYGPTAFHTAYNLPCTPGGSVAATCATPSTFGPTTIAIVDAGNFASGVSGLNASLADYDSYLMFD
jgi:hypothetical protein